MKKFCEKCGSRMSIKLVSVNTRLNHGIYTYKARCLTDLKRRRKFTILALLLANLLVAVISAVIIPFGIVTILLAIVMIVAVNIAVVEVINRYAPVETDIFNANFSVDLSHNRDNKADY